MVESARYIPARGDFVWVEFDPQAGREQAGRRPGLVLSEKIFNKASGLALVCPITSKLKGYPFEIPVPGGGKMSGAVLADHLRSLDWQVRNMRLIARAPAGFADLVAQFVWRLISKEPTGAR
jgi:mRNA interferase MazF